MSYHEDVFDNCPSCQGRSVFSRKIIVYKCPKCRRFFCDKCIAGNRWRGYKCPYCTFHIPFPRFAEIAMGIC